MSAVAPTPGVVAEAVAPRGRIRGPLSRVGGGGGRGSGRWPAWRIAIVVFIAALYGVPLLASIKFSLIQSNGHYGLANYKAIIDSGAVRASGLLSLEIAAIVAFVSVLLMVPTVILLRLKLPKLTIWVEAITILPIVVPPIVFVAGIYEMKLTAPLWVVHLLFNHDITALAPFYLIFSLPLMYRSIDTGVRAIDLHTLVDASRNLGASWPATILRVILPNIQTAVIGGMFLTVALCLGEVVLAGLLDLPTNTYPVEMIQFSQQDNAPGVSVAMTLISFGFTFLVLFALTFLARRRGIRSTRLI